MSMTRGEMEACYARAFPATSSTMEFESKTSALRDAYQAALPSLAGGLSGGRQAPGLPASTFPSSPASTGPCGEQPPGTPCDRSSAVAAGRADCGGPPEREAALASPDASLSADEFREACDNAAWRATEALDQPGYADQDASLWADWTDRVVEYGPVTRGRWLDENEEFDDDVYTETGFP